MAFGPLLVAGVTLKDLSLTGVDARLVLALPPPLLLPENEDIKIHAFNCDSGHTTTDKRSSLRIHTRLTACASKNNSNFKSKYTIRPK